MTLESCSRSSGICVHDAVETAFTNSRNLHLGELALDRVHRLGTLVGFNIGVELGQFIFLAVVITLVSLGCKMMSKTGLKLWPRLPAAAAAVLGALMLAQRLAIVS